MPDASNPRQLVVFTLGAEHYALPIQQVHEIIRYSEPRSVASRADWVRGVISLRGRIVPVYDLAVRLGVPSSELTEHTKIVIVEAGSETAGVIVDGVEEVLTVDDEQMQDAPGADTTLIDSIAKIDDRLVVLLKPSAIFSGPDLALAA
ncbi:MAG TPA: chemotaxis protein CheW [Solirubrobacteraceae bacterium]|nr:chemotaxis protein CheW [Solirubrobacteraceae bacterium]